MVEIIFIGILGVLTYTDLKYRRIPNVLLAVALVVKLLFFLIEEGNSLNGLLGMLGDGLAISLPLLFLTLLMEKILKKRTMGGGDIKLIFVTGIYLGWENNLKMLFGAGILALLLGGLLKEKEIPFGPAIAIATVLSML